MRVSRGFVEPIDLLLTDVIIPGMTGSELALEFSAERRDAKIIFMSGYTNHAVLNHADLPPGVRFLEKPIATRQLLRTIREALS